MNKNENPLTENLKITETINILKEWLQSDSSNIPLDLAE
jgi:hypothetical protein